MATEPLLLTQGSPTAPPSNEKISPAVSSSSTVASEGIDFNGVDPLRPGAGPREKIGGIAEKIGQKFGMVVTKLGRGRPRKDGQPKISDTVDKAPVENPVAAAPPSAPPPSNVFVFGADETFAQSCIEGVLKGYLDFKFHGVLRMALKVTADELHPKGDRRWSEEKIAEIRPTKDEIENFCRNVVIVLKKWNVPLTYLPEISLVATIVQWEMRSRGFIQELRDILDERDRKAAQLKKAA